MGAKKTRNTDLPERMLARYRGEKTWYYYDTGGKPRREIPLGSDKIIGLSKYSYLHNYFPVGIPLPEDFEKGLYSIVKKRASRNSMEIDLTEKDIKDMLIASDYKCSVTGIKFEATKYKGQRIRPWVPSVDRVNPFRGYTKDNTRIVCAAVNIAMNQFGDEIFNRIMAYAAKSSYKDFNIER